MAAKRSLRGSGPPDCAETDQVPPGGRSTSPATTRLICESDAVQIGQPFWLAVVLEMQPDWHCYWLNPGHTGFSPKLKWFLPESFHIGETFWPQPIRFMAFGQIGFGYENRLAWLVEITPPEVLPSGGQIEIVLKAEWLLCRDVCIRDRVTHELVLPVSPPASANVLSNRDVFDRFRLNLPQRRDEGLAAVFFKEGESWVLRLQVPEGIAVKPTEVYFFPCDAGWIDPVTDQATSVQGTTLLVRMRGCDSDRSAPDELHGVLVWREGHAGSDHIVARRITAPKN